MALPDYDMRQLLEAGVHFGHQKHRWNPKMGTYIFGARNDIHIIDLAQTVPLLHQALLKVSEIVAKGGRVLFVGTKRQASDIIAEAAKRSAQYYINHRWLGGTLTNWRTVSNSINRLRKLEEIFEGETQGLTKKELLQLTRERNKLERALGGIKDMGGIPDVLFVIDTNKEAIAVAEAKKLKIPVIAVVDSNSDPDMIDYPVPGNDDAGRAISLYCDLVARAAIDGIERSQVSAGVDVGAAEKPVKEKALDKPATNGAAPEAKTPKTADSPETAKSKPAEKSEKPADNKKADEPEKPAKTEPEAAHVEKTDTPTAEADAGKQKEEGGYKGLKAPDGEPDDLKQITGVGKVIEDKLNTLGVYHYRQIAAFTPDDIANVDNELNFKGRIERDGWIDQAAKLAAEQKS